MSAKQAIESSARRVAERLGRWLEGENTIMLAHWIGDIEREFAWVDGLIEAAEKLLAGSCSYFPNQNPEHCTADHVAMYAALAAIPGEQKEEGRRAGIEEAAKIADNARADEEYGHAAFRCVQIAQGIRALLPDPPENGDETT